MQQLDPSYLKAALETLDLIMSLLQYYSQTHSIDKFSDIISQIEAKANFQLSTELKRILEIDIPAIDLPSSDNKPSTYWHGVRDMTQMLIKRWTLGDQDVLSFQAMMLQIKKDLGEKIPDVSDNPLEAFLDELRENKDPSQATPSVYYPPYPKPPPEGMAEAHEKPKTLPIIGGSPDESPPEKEISKDNSQPLATRILENTEENDELLSQSLRDALRILRDED